MYVCMYVRMYVCTYVCVYVRMYVCTAYVGTYVRISYIGGIWPQIDDIWLHYQLCFAATLHDAKHGPHAIGPATLHAASYKHASPVATDFMMASCYKASHVTILKHTVASDNNQMRQIPYSVSLIHCICETYVRPIGCFVCCRTFCIQRYCSTFSKRQIK